MQIKTGAKLGNVIVIGAGMAGLSAAKELAEKGFDVLVLESRDRSGGRIWTDFSLDVPVDLGAAWIHGKKKNPIFDLARKNRIKMAPSGFTKAELIDDDGKKVSQLRQILNAGRANRIMPRLKRLAKRLDKDVSVAEAIRMLIDETGMKGEELLFLNRHLIEFQALNAANLEEQSLFALTEDSLAFEGGDLVFPEGFAQIFENMTQGIHIKYRETVLAVNHTDHGVTVETNKGKHDADAVVITLPLGVLKAGRVKFSPPLPQSMQSSIEKVTVGAFNKIAMRFKETFWNPDCDSIELASAKSDFVCQFVNWHKHSKEPILIACLAADTARKWEGYSDEEVESRMEALLKRMYGSSASKPVSTVITRWGQDQFASGAYSVVRPGNNVEDFEALAQPVGRLFFAGEATARLNQGTVPGAYLSGMRAAKQLAENTSRVPVLVG